MSSTESVAAQKQSAIDQHSRQADEFADRYEQLETSRFQSCFAYSRFRLESLLDLLLPKANGLRLLDVGCGTGHHLAQLRERGFDVAGVDGSDDMLKRARELNPEVDLHRADVDRLPFPDASFDVVLCVEVLRYLPDASKCIAEMGRVLRPGGVCLATATPFLNLNGYWPINRMAGMLPFRLVRLKQFFSTSSGMRKRFANASFASTAVHGVYLGPINWVERLLPPALPLALRMWQPFDRLLADRYLIREFSNMFLVHAVKGPTETVHLSRPT